VITKECTGKRKRRTHCCEIKEYITIARNMLILIESIYVEVKLYILIAHAIAGNIQITSPDDSNESF